MIPQIARGVLLTAVFAAVPWASPVLADVLVLNDGKVVEGEVADKGETYEVKTQYGTLAIRKGDVKKFVKGSGVGAAEAAPRESAAHVPPSDVKPPAATELAPPLAPPSLNPATGSSKIAYTAMIRDSSQVTLHRNVTLHHNVLTKGHSSIVGVLGSGEVGGEGDGEKKKEGKPRGDEQGQQGQQGDQKEKKKEGNPRGDSPPPASTTITLDCRNNVVWGWSRSAIFIGSGAAVNLVGNCFAAAGGDKDTAAVVWAKGVAPKLFAAGNVSADAGAKDPNGIGTEKAPFPAAPVSTTDARAAARDVLAGAGARPLDTIDQELLRSVSASGR